MIRREPTRDRLPNRRTIPCFPLLDAWSSGDADVVLTTLDRDCSEFDHLIGHSIELEGVEFVCADVRAGTGDRPLRKGALIEIVLRRPPTT